MAELDLAGGIDAMAKIIKEVDAAVADGTLPAEWRDRVIIELFCSLLRLSEIEGTAKYRRSWPL